jgi:hypothetical protein
VKLTRTIKKTITVTVDEVRWGTGALKPSSPLTKLPCNFCYKPIDTLPFAIGWDITNKTSFRLCQDCANQAVEGGATPMSMGRLL